MYFVMLESKIFEILMNYAHLRLETGHWFFILFFFLIVPWVTLYQLSLLCIITIFFAFLSKRLKTFLNEAILISLLHINEAI